MYPHKPPLTLEKYRFKTEFNTIKLTIGAFYLINNQGPYVFIKVTKKGFNFLPIGTDKCLLTERLLYARGYGYKDLPVDEKTFDFWVHVNYNITEIQSPQKMR